VDENVPAESVPVAEESELDAPVDAPVVEVEPAPPSQCELLLEALEMTTPAYTALQEQLAEYTGRVEDAVSSLNRERPAPAPRECPQNESVNVSDKEVIGAIEWLYMEPPGRHYRARVDSGAETSSLSAKDIIEFERDGDDWVRFTFEHEGRDDEPVEIELPIERTVLIRAAAAEGEPQRRFVVEMDIRLGERLQTTEFTLTDRSSMTYPVLLGRAFLLDLYVIDVSESYVFPRYEPTS